MGVFWAIAGLLLVALSRQPPRKAGGQKVDASSGSPLGGGVVFGGSGAGKVPGALIPGTSYRLAPGSALSPSGKVHISEGGCVRIQVPEGSGNPAAMGLSVGIVRADGVASTFTLPGLWAPATPGDAACYAAVQPRTALARLMGDLSSIVPLVSSSIASGYKDVRGAIEKEWPALSPLVALAEGWTGIDLATQGAALIEGAKNVGVPIDSLRSLVEQPESTIKALAAESQQWIQTQAQGAKP